MTPEELCQSIRTGRRVYGTLIVSPSPRWPEAVAQIGLDFVFIDTEHIALDRAQLSWMCQTYRALGLPPIVRIPAADPFAARMALDGGAVGIVAPYVEKVEQVQALRGAVKFRPLQGEKLEAALDDDKALEPTLRKYLDEANRRSLLIINVESRPAVDRLDALLSVPGVDGILIGPHDLSCSLGVPENYDEPRFDETVREICRRARSAGVAAGIHSWLGGDRIIKWAEEGLNLIVYSADILAARDLLTAEVRSLRVTLGDPIAAGLGASPT